MNCIQNEQTALETVCIILAQNFLGDHYHWVVFFHHDLGEFTHDLRYFLDASRAVVINQVLIMKLMNTTTYNRGVHPLDLDVVSEQIKLCKIFIPVTFEKFGERVCTWHIGCKEESGGCDTEEHVSEKDDNYGCDEITVLIVKLKQKL